MDRGPCISAVVCDEVRRKGWLERATANDSSLDLLKETAELDKAALMRVEVHCFHPPCAVVCGAPGRATLRAQSMYGSMDAHASAPVHVVAAIYAYCLQAAGRTAKTKEGGQLAPANANSPVRGPRPVGPTIALRAGQAQWQEQRP